jgi:hypothetical protein
MVVNEPGTYVMIFKIFPHMYILSLFFLKKTLNVSPKIGENRRKLAKIAENCDHNTDPYFYIFPGQTAIAKGFTKVISLSRVKRTNV